MNIYGIKNVLEEIAALSTQAEWDNSGVQICFGPKNIKKILVAMEINNEIIDEAIANKVDMIVTHHPLIFTPLKSLHFCDPTSNNVMRLVQAGIVVYSSHTPFDIAKGGNTEYLMKLMGVKKIKVVPGTENFVKVGMLDSEISLGDFTYKLSELLKLDGLKFTGDANKKIRTVACCTGAGSEFWKEASEYAQVFITGDVKHHEAAFANQVGLALIDAGHWGTEQIFVPNMAAQLRKKLGTSVKILESKVNLEPFSYMV